MNLSPIAGLLLGGIILGAALTLSQINLATLFNLESILIVFGGTLAAIMVGFSSKGVLQAVDSFWQCLFYKRISHREQINYIGEIATFVRTEGILAVKPMLQEIEIPFIRKGVELVMDNRKADFVRDTLSTDMEVNYRNSMDNARLFEAAGGYAPTMGIIGAVIGLIHSVSGFSEPELLAQGIAGAFSATLWGVATANLFLLPVASKLRQQAREEWFQKTILLEGILSIQRGDHPIITEERLKAFLNSVNQPAGFQANANVGLGSVDAGHHLASDAAYQALVSG